MKKAKRSRRSPLDRRLPSPACSLLPLMAAGLVATNAQARPSVALPAPTQLPTPSSNFVYRGAGSFATSGSGTNPVMDVTQSTAQVGYHWDRFDVGSDATVNFRYTQAGPYVTLNRIGSADPAVIMGHVNSDGQLYLINQNGILFGDGAQVNVGGLVASALNVSDDLLDNGLPANRGDSLRFSWGGDATGFASSFVAVDPGARITTPSGGRVVLLAPSLVENRGAISNGSGGETILAAGGSVLLTAPDDPNLRGLMVQVSSFTGKDEFGNTVTVSGTTTNGTGATIDATNGGVVTLAGLTVNQEGTLKAGRAVNLNGDIMLVASTPETPLLTITQSGDTAQIDWSGGFAPIDANHRVQFVQPTSGAVAYNFVNDHHRTAAGSGSATTIDGSLTANGQLFLINEKGIHFGAHANVNAANFVASALGMNSDILTSGLLSQTNYLTPAFSLWSTPPVRGSADADNALAAFRQSAIDVAAGATITTNNGYTILAAGKVDQAGTINTPNGQTILAAGANLYLMPPYGQALRGFSAEVDPLYASDGTTRVPLSRGADVNSVNQRGTITAAFGNITLVGHDVTQSGVLRTSTSVSRNGSIRLLARDLAVAGLTYRAVVDGTVGTADVVPGSDKSQAFVFGTQGGTLTLTKGSITDVALDGSDGQTITSLQSFTPSLIEAAAANINVEGSADGVDGARLTAAGGKIQMTAAATFDISNALTGDSLTLPQTPAASSDTNIFVGSGALLDVSGATAQKSVADLFVPVQLRGDEFASDTVQRNGALRGLSATVDMRDPVAIADLSAYFSGVGQTVMERAAAGGGIALRSQGSVVVKPDATLNVSGGQVDYAAGQVTESRAVTRSGVSYRLNDASSLLTYTGLVNVTRQERAYVEGKSAGSVEIDANNIALGGTLLGNTVRGERQRNLTDPSSDRYGVPLGAKLIIKDSGQHYQPTGPTDAEMAAAYGQSQIAFVAGRATTADALSFGDAAGPQLQLSQSLVASGFSRFDIQSDGRIDVPAGVTLNLAPGGSFSAKGRQVHVGGAISAPGGSIALTTRDMSTSAAVGVPTGTGNGKYSNLIMDGGASLSTAGLWVNDSLAASAANLGPKSANGGSITLSSAYDLQLGTGTTVDVSGGGALDAKGKLTAGDAGSIKLASGTFFGRVDSTDKTAHQDSRVVLNGNLAGYALGKGGSLEIDTSQVLLGGTTSAVGAAFDADFLNRGGFLNFKFVGYDGVIVQDGAVIAPKPLSWVLAGSAYRRQATGASLADLVQTQRLHPDLRAPTSLALATGSAYYGNLTVGNDAYLGVDPTGSISLTSKAQLTVLGTLEAPAGTITLTRNLNPSEDGVVYSDTAQSEAIVLGPRSRLLAKGTTKLDAATRSWMTAGVSVDALLAQGLYRGQVLGGGRVNIDAGLGYLITESGSLIDVSGSRDTLSAAHVVGRSLSYAPVSVGSAGGEVDLAARDGMFLDGGFQAAGSSGAPGGVFSLRLGDASYVADPWKVGDLTNFDPATRAALIGPRVLSLFQSTGGHPQQWPAGLAADGSELLDPAQYNGNAHLDLSLLSAGGFGSWYLQSQGRIGFEGTINATVANQLRLDSPVFSASSPTDGVSLTAAAIQIGNYGPVSEQSSAATATPATGTANFSANARDLALVGNFTWNGFGVSSFGSTGDIHFDGMQNAVDRNGRYPTLRDADGQPVTDADGNAVADPLFTGRLYNGGLRTTGTVNFAAARLYPSTYTDFVVDDGPGTINIARQGSAGLVMSAEGRLEFRAADIEDHGTVAAPLGQVAFTAPAVGGKVNLWGDSVTTVAADGLVPLGFTTLSGREWSYLIAGNTVTAPEKSITVDGADTHVMTGAVLDLSGGGEAAAWEFTPGPGGKTDILAASADAAPTVFAILPGWQGNFAPADAQTQTYYNVSHPTATTDAQGNVSYSYDSVPSLKPGDQIQLAANPLGLTGNYTLLPASYAHLRGAVLVTIKSSQDSVIAGAQAQADGSWLVAGTRLAANADGSYSAYSQRPLTLELAGQSVSTQRASYLRTTASGFFYDTAGAQLPGDAGHLAVAGRTSLVFDPVVLGRRDNLVESADGRSRAGQGLQVDLAAPKLAVVDSGTSAPDAGWSTLDKDMLNGIGASSLLIGGLRSVAGDTTSIETVAAAIHVATSGDVALQGPELLLTATDDLTVAGHSKLAATGDAPAGNIVLAGDGAFVRVAGGNQASLQRTGAVTRSKGDLTVSADASIQGHALILDATRKNAVAPGSLRLANLGQAAGRGGALAFGAGRINVVGDGSTPADGLTLSNADLAAYGNPDQIRLTSYSTIDLYGPAVLGSSGLGELTLAAAGIAGHGDSATTATIEATSVRFENPNFGSAEFTPGAALGGGQLDVEADTVTFGSNADADMRAANTTGFAMRGFDGVTVNATKEMRFEGTGVTAVDNAGGSGAPTSLTVNAGRVVAATGSNHRLSASGAGRIAGGGNTGTVTELGGKLAIDAKSLDVSGRVEAPSGRLTLAATGSAPTDGVTIEGVVAAEGTAVQFGDTTAYAPGGQIVLKSAAGNVAVADGASVSVSGAAGGGDAGSLSLIAQHGAVSAGANTLSGAASSADATASGGTLTVDANSVSADNLANAVKTGHFTGQWDVRARNGNLALSKTVTAAKVRLAADNGNIDIAGKIDASGAKGGTIELYANRGASTGGHLTLEAGSQLLANARQVVGGGQGTAGQGGTVILGVSASDTANENQTALTFAAADATRPAALIDVSPAAGSQATGGKVIFRVPSGIGSSQLTLNGTVAGARTATLEVVKTVQQTGNYTLDAGNQAALLAQAQAAATSAAALASASNITIPSLVYRPGVDLRATGDITIASDWNLDSARYNGQPGYLTLHAQGNLIVKGTVNDGFTTVSPDATMNASGDSWSYQFVAGADPTAANPLAVNASAATGNMTIAPGKIVRTGTGDISLAAAGDIQMADTSAIYTAGLSDTTTPDGFKVARVLVPPPGIRPIFPVGGGDIALSAGANICMVHGGTCESPMQSPVMQDIGEWLVRAGATATTSTEWWPRIGSFRQGIGALGGGDVTLAAGKDVQNLNVAIPTSGRVPGTIGAEQVDLADIQGGGDLHVQAGGSIVGGQFYAETGNLRLTAGEDVAPGSRLKAEDNNNIALAGETAVNTTIALGNAAARVTAGGSAAIGSVFDPLSAPTHYVTSAGADLSSPPEFTMALGTFGDRSGLNVVAVTGDVAMSGSDSPPVGLSYFSTGRLGNSTAYQLAPARLELVSLNGNVTAGNIEMTPAVDGQLDLLAARSITVPEAITQLDVPAGQLPSIGNPRDQNQVNALAPAILAAQPPAVQHAANLWHATDTQPSRLIALAGDITGTVMGSIGAFDEAVEIQAGGDIVNPSMTIQQTRSSDVSRITAGGDIRFTTDHNQSGTLQVTGPGQLQVTAGGGVDLGNSTGIVTRGNLENPFLPEGGAGVLVIAGATPDYAGFRASLGVGTDVGEAALRDTFFAMLRDAGREALAGGGTASYEKGREVIKALFPAGNVSGGDIDLFASMIKTEQGGGIDLLAPGGSVTVGIANPGGDLLKSAADQGLFTIRGGAIRTLVSDSFLVAKSRVFTLDGGDILVWADRGVINAGYGAKTLNATPPPTLVIRNGQIVLDTSSSISGSGIATLASKPTTPASDMDLFAPQGSIDAGDAGLRSTGKVNLGALQIFNASNIQAAGGVAGAPVAVQASVPTIAPTTATTAENANDTIAKQPMGAGGQQGILTVEVLGTGDEGGSPPSDADEDARKKKKKQQEEQEHKG